MRLKSVANREMDSRLRGNDKQISCHHGVIPAKAGIHARTSKKLQENLTALLSERGSGNNALFPCGGENTHDSFPGIDIQLFDGCQNTSRRKLGDKAFGVPYLVEGRPDLVIAGLSFVTADFNQ